MFQSLLVFLLVISATSLALGFYRLFHVLSRDRPRPYRSSRQEKGADGGKHMVIVLGSGGHTAEMIAMLSRATTTTVGSASDSEAVVPQIMDWSKYSKRTWIVSSGDRISGERAKDFEDGIVAKAIAASFLREGGANDDKDDGLGNFLLEVVPRARAIHQSIWSAPWSSLRCTWGCLQVLLRSKYGFPDLILCNGPATATILILTSVGLRFFNLRRCHSEGKMRTVYVESWARVKKLSLSGHVLSRVVDRFLVQWPELEKMGGRTEYIGVLV